MYEVAVKRNRPVVTIQWLFDCFRLHARQPEERYLVSGRQLVSSPMAQQNYAPPVLATHNVLISPSALGSDAQLPQMAEELGASVHTWRSVDELMVLLQSCGVLIVD